MSNNDEIFDFGILVPPTHEALAKLTDSKVSDVFETVTRIENKVDHLTNKVDHLIGELTGLSRMVARLPSGITLVNAVGQILDTVNEIKQEV